MNTSVYIHIPFCKAKCIYCDFLSYSCSPEAPLVQNYLQALLKEIRLSGQKLQQAGIKVGTLYIGGGTPTILTPQQLEMLFSACRRHLPLNNPEWTVEANPGTLTAEKIGIMAKNGVNRISLGVQDLCNERLAMLGRLHTADQAEQAFLSCKKNFPVVSVDLMVGLPGQAEADLLATLAQVCQWGPQHLSLYGLMVEEHTPLAEAVNSGAVTLPAEEENLAMFWAARRFLSAHGYEAYEIANFARKGYWCRHNLTYWRNLPYLGLGLGAHSFWQRQRLVNTDKMQTYLALLEEDVLPVARRQSVSRRQEMEDTMMLGLRLREGVSFASFASRFGIDLRDVFAVQIERLLQLGLIECTHGAVRLTATGLPVANYVFAEFLEV